MASLPRVTEYIKNVGKSTVYVAKKELEELAPNITGTIKASNEIFKITRVKITDAKRMYTDYKKGYRNAAAEFYKTPVGGIVKDAKANVLDSLKTGNFYDPKREDSAMMKAMGFDDFDDDFDFDSSYSSNDTNFDDFDDESSDIDNGSKIVAKATSDAISKSSIGISSYLSKSIGEAGEAQAAVTAKSASYISEAIIGMGKVQLTKMDSILNVSKIGFNTIHDDISRTNIGIEAIAKSQEYAVKYYNDSMEIFKENNALLKELTEMQRNLYKRADWQEARYSNMQESSFDKVLGYGKLDGKALKDSIFKNIKSMTGFDISKSGMSDSMGSGGTLNLLLSTLAANPLQLVLGQGLKLFTNKAGKKAVESLDQTLGSVLGVAFKKLMEAKESDGFFKSTLAKILLPAFDDKKNVNTGKYEKGAVPFDGLTRQAIIETIPGYLRRIEAALTQDEERFYDLEKGKWKKKSNVISEFDTESNMNQMFAMWDLNNAINSYMDSDKGKSKHKNINKNKMKKQVHSFMDQVYKNNGVIDFKKDDMYGMDPEVFTAVMAAVNGTDKGRNARKKLTLDVIKAKQDHSAFLRDIEANPASLYRAMYNGDISTKGTLSESAKDKKKNILEKLTDSFNNNIFFYLKGIYDAVTTGKKKKTESTVSGTPGLKEAAVSTPKIRLKQAREAQAESEEEDDWEPDKYDAGFEEAQKRKDEEDKKSGKAFKKSFWENVKEKLGGKISKAKDGTKALKAILEVPGDMITGMVEKADRHLYKFLFGDDYEALDKEKKINGLFGTMTSKLDTLFKDISENVKKIFDDKLKPLAEWFSDQFGVVKNTLGELFSPIFSRAKEKVGNAASTAWGDAKGMFASIFNRGRVNDNGQNAFGGRVVRGGLTVVSPGETILPAHMSLSGKRRQYIQEGRLLNRLYGGNREDDSEAEAARAQVQNDPLMTEFLSYNPTDSEKELVQKRLNEHPEDREKILKGAIKTKKRQAKAKTNKEKGAAYADAIRGGISDAFTNIADKLSSDDKEKKKASNIIGKTIKDIFGKNGGPTDMLASGLIGGGVSTLFGLVGGPLAGFAVGAGINILKNSETMQKFLFGNEKHEGGVLPKEFLDKAEKLGVNVRKGAVAGALSAFVGPWGLLGGAVLGAGTGILSSTNAFKDAVFGKEDKDGKRQGGLVGSLKKYTVEPLKKGVESVVEGVKDYFQKDIVSPLQEFIKPATQAIKNIGYSIRKKIFDNRFTRAIVKPIEATFDRVSKFLTKGIKSVLGIPAKLIGGLFSLPFKALGAVGNRIRASQIKRGTANDLTAQETLQFAQEHPELFMGKLGFARNAANGALGFIQKKTGLLQNVTGFTPKSDNYSGLQNDMQIAGYTDEELEGMIGRISKLQNLNKTRTSNIGQEFYNDLKGSGLLDKLGSGTYDKLHKAMASGDPRQVEKILADKTLFGKRKINKEDSDKLRSMLLARTNEVGKLNDLNTTKDEAFQSALSIIGQDFAGIKTGDDLDKLRRRLEGERSARAKNGTSGIQGSELFADEEGNETVLSEASLQTENAIHETTKTIADKIDDVIANLSVIAEHDINSGNSLKFTDSLVGQTLHTHQEGRETNRIEQRSEAIEIASNRSYEDTVTNKKYKIKFSDKFGLTSDIDFASIGKKRIDEVHSLKGKFSPDAVEQLLNTDNDTLKIIKELDKQGVLEFEVKPEDIEFLQKLSKSEIDVIIYVHKQGKFSFKNTKDIDTIKNAISTVQVARVVIDKIKNAGVNPETAEEFVKFTNAGSSVAFDRKNKSVKRNLGQDIGKVVASISANKSMKSFMDKAKDHFANSPFASVLQGSSEEQPDQTSAAKRRRLGISGGAGEETTTQISKHGHVITYEDGKPADDTETRKGLKDNQQSEVEDRENSLNIKSMLGETKSIFTHLFGEMKDKAKKAPGVLSKIGEKVSTFGKGLKKILLFLGIVGAGVVAHKSGLLQQFGDFLKEKVWPPLKEFVTEKLWPPVKSFITEKVWPWVTDVAIPALVTGIVKAIPTAIAAGVKAALGIADGIAGASNKTIGSSTASTSYTTTDGKTVTGNSTASNSKTIEKESNGILSKLFGKKATNEINYLTDENGNFIKGYIDEEGNIIQDENGSYIPVNNTYKQNNTTDTFGSKILKGAHTSFIHGLMGNASSAAIFGNSGKVINAVSKHFGIIGKGIGLGAKGIGTAADKVVGGANKFGQSLRNGSIANFFSGKLGEAAVENVDDMVAGSGADFVAAAMENADEVGSMAAKAAETAEKTGMLSGIKTKLFSVMKTLMENKQVAGFFAKVAKFCGTKLSDTALGTALTTFAEKMVEKFGQNAATNALSSAASAAASLPLIDIVFACVYFGTGFYNAATLLGITEGDITLPYKLLGGFLNVFKVIPVVGIIISVIGVDTLVNLFCDVILKGLFKIEDTDLQKKRENAAKELDKWNAEHPEETYDNLKDFNNKDKLLTKAGNVLKKTGKAITDTVFGKNKDYKASYTYNGITTNVNIPDTYSNKATNVSNKLGVEGGARSFLPQSHLVPKDNNFSVMGTWSRLSSGISEMIKAAQNGDLSTIQNTISESIDNTPAGKMVGIMLNTVSPILSMSSLFYNLLNKLSKGMSSFVRGMGNLSNEVNKNVKNSFSKVKNGNDLYSKNVWNIPNYKSRLQGLAGVIAPIVDLTQRMAISPIYSSMGIINNVAGMAGSIGKMLGQPVNTTSVGFSSAPRYNTTTGTMTSSPGGGFLQGVKNFFGGIGKFFTGGKRLGISGGSGHVYQESSGLKNVPYGNSTLGELGCGPVAATNVLNSLGYGGNVADAANYAEYNGFTNNSGTDMGFIPSYLGSKGIDTYTTSNAGEAEAALRNGNQVMLLGQDGGKRYRSGRKAFGGSSHFITAKGIDGSGRVKVEDPDLPGGSRYYGVDEVLGNAKMATIVGKKRSRLAGAGHKFLSKFGLFGGAKEYSPDTVIQVAKNEVGYLEKKSNSKLDDKTANAGSNNYTKYGKWIGAPGAYWCASFVSWCFYKAYGEKAGKKVLGTYSAACNGLKSHMKTSSKPKVGDVIFFKGSRHDGANHVGIVYKVTDNKVYTIEGNTSGASKVVDNGGGVVMKSYKRSNSKIICYGHPNYTTEASTSNESSSDADNASDIKTNDDTTDSNETTNTTTSYNTGNSYSDTGFTTTTTVEQTPSIFTEIANSAKKIMKSTYGSDVYETITGETETSGGKRRGLFGRARAQYGPDGMAYGGSPHYITAVGMDDDDVYVEDPDLPGETYKYPKSEVFNNMTAASIVGGKRNNFKDFRDKYGISGGAGSFGNDYLAAAQYWVDKVYQRVYDCKCIHGKTAHTYEEIPKKKHITCTGSASIVFQQAGMIPKGKIVSHTPKAGRTFKMGKTKAILKKYGGSFKHSIKKALKNEKYLIKGTCDIVRVFKKFKDMPAWLRQKGIFYIQDSNGCVSAGNGKIYSCNNSVGEKYGKGHKAVLKTHGYPFNAYILFAFVPRSNGKSNVPENCPFDHCMASGSGTPKVHGKLKDTDDSSSTDYIDTDSSTSSSVSDINTGTSSGTTVQSESIFTKLANAGSQMMRSIYGEDVYDSIFGTVAEEEGTTYSDSSSESSSNDGADDSSSNGADDDKDIKLSGSKNADKIWNYLKHDMKLGNYGAAAVMGNWEQESGLNPANLQNSHNKKLGYTDKAYTKAIDNGKIGRSEFSRKGTGGYGLAQWTDPGRKKNFYDYMKKEKGRSIGDLAGQLGFFNKEAKKYKALSRHSKVDRSKVGKHLIPILQNDKSVEEAVKDFEYIYEEAGKAEMGNRLKYAKKYYKKYKDKKAPTTTPTNNGTTTPTANGTTSDKKYTNGTRAGRGRTEVIDKLNSSMSKNRNSYVVGGASIPNTSNTTDTAQLLAIIIKILYSIANNTEAISKLAEVMKNNGAPTNISINESDSKLSSAKMSAAQAKAAIQQLMSSNAGSTGGFTSLLQDKPNEYILSLMDRLAKE